MRPIVFDHVRTERPPVATAEAPVPNWGRQVDAGYGTASWNRRNADAISRTIPHHLVLFSVKPYANRESRLSGSRIPHRSLTRLRLDDARVPIAEGPKPLAEVAPACGVSSQNHLTAPLRREDGLTPGALRA